LPFARGFFFHFPLTTAHVNTWHPHIYDKPVRNPTPFLISNILNLNAERRADGGRHERHEHNSPSSSPTSFSNDVNGNNLASEYFNAGRMFSTRGGSHFQGLVIPKTGNGVERRAHHKEAEEQTTRGARHSSSPCSSFLRDHVESPHNGKNYVCVARRGSSLFIQCSNI